MTTQTLPTPSKSTTEYRESDGTHAHGLLTTIVRDVKWLNDYLSGPPMTERERIDRLLAEIETARKIVPLAF